MRCAGELVRKRLRASLDTEYRSSVRVSSANVVVARSVAQKIRDTGRCLVCRIPFCLRRFALLY